MRYRAILRKGAFSSVRFFDSADYANAVEQAEWYVARAEGFGSGWHVMDVYEDHSAERGEGR